MNLDPLDCFLKFMKIISHKRNWAGHFAVDTSSINADTNVIVFYSFLSEDSDIFRLTASCHAMHDYDNRLFSVIFGFPEPVQGNMSAICEKDSFSIEGHLNLWGVKFKYGLKVMGEKVWSGVVERHILLDFDGEEGSDSS
jgi:hypothetical protein